MSFQKRPPLDSLLVFLNKGKDFAEAIAKKFNVNKTTVYRWFKFYKVDYNQGLRRYGDFSGMTRHGIYVIELSGESKNSNRLWNCRCHCGNNFKVESAKIKHIKSCGCVSFVQRDEKELLTGKILLPGQTFNRLTVIKLLEERKQEQRQYLCKCSCGKETKLSCSSIKSGRTKSCGCLDLELKKARKGSKHPNWRSDLSEEDRALSKRRNLDPRVNEWTKSVLERDRYTCQISGEKGEMVAHHIRSWESNKDIRFDINNGITISRHLHLLFHKIYGFKNNDQRHLDDFILKYKSGGVENIFLFLEGKLIELLNTLAKPITMQDIVLNSTHGKGFTKYLVKRLIKKKIINQLKYEVDKRKFSYELSYSP